MTVVRQASEVNKTALIVKNVTKIAILVMG
jgi:hypothetical protein